MLKKYLNTTLNLLKALRVNQPLADIENSIYNKTFRRALESLFNKQVKALATTEIIEQAFNMNKAKSNPDLVDFLRAKLPEWDKTTQRELGLLLYISSITGGDSALSLLNSDLEFNLRDKDILIKLLNRKVNLKDVLNMTTAEYIARIIEDSEEGYLDTEETKSELISKNPSKSRVRGIAVNESNWAINEIEYETFKRAGTQRVKWVTAFDERVCPICGPLEGTEYNIDEVERPPIHVNCRCFLEPTVVMGIDLDRLWNGDSMRNNRDMNTITYIKDVELFEEKIKERNFTDAKKIYDKVPYDSNRKEYFNIMMELLSLGEL